jgi:hypothetical protein
LSTFASPPWKTMGKSPFLFSPVRLEGPNGQMSTPAWP